MNKSTNLPNKVIASQIIMAEAIAIEDIHPSPTNPRKTFPEEAQAEMVKSVQQHGVMQPILVRPWPEQYPFEGNRPKYELIAGERRYRAAKEAGLPFIAATVRDLDDHETLELQIVENLHRKDLNEIEEAEGYEMMIKRYSYTAAQLADKINKSKAYIYARLKLTALCEAAREAFHAKTIDASTALLLARLPTAALQQEALEDITGHWNGPMSFRAAAQLVQARYMLKLTEAVFDINDHFLIADAGPCSDCPKRTGNNPELYQDVKSADVCTDPDCFAGKKAAHFEQLKTAAVSQGKTVIDGEAAEKLLRDGEWAIKGYAKLDAKCNEAEYDEEKGYPTYKELLADKNIPTSLIQRPDGSLIEVVERAAIKAVAEEVGIRTTTKANDHDKTRIAAEQAETAFRQRLFGEIREATQENFEEHPQFNQRELALIARQFLSCAWHENQKRLGKLWAEKEAGPDSHNQIQHLFDTIDTWPEVDLMRLIIDTALVGMSHVGSYATTETPAILLATAERLFISPSDIRQQMTDTPAAQPAKPASPAVAYMHPENNTLCWSGRGKKPKWVEHWLSNGGTLDALETSPSSEKKATSAACDITPTRCDKTLELPLA